MDFKNRFEESCAKTRLVGASAVIVQEEEIEEEVSFGYQSLETKEPVTPKTIFRIASISKIIVAMAVMALVEEGKLRISDDIGTILGFPIRNPHFPDIPITIEMLMTQTSSITDGFDDEDPRNEHDIRGYNGVNGTSWNVGLRDLLVPSDGKYYTSGTWDQAKPGTKFIYSNFGCGILACICEAVTGEYFTDYVSRRILKPLQLDASFRASEIVAKEKIATLYNRTGNPEDPYKVSRSKDSFILSGYPRFSLSENYRGPAGGLFISMHDLSKILRVLMNDGSCYGIRILKKETVDMMLQMHWYGHDDPTYHAKGLQLKLMDDFDHRLFAGHTGSAYGVVSFLFFSPIEKIGACFITNGGYYTSGTKGMTDIQEEVFQAFLDSYWPEKTRAVTFSFLAGADFGTVNGRTIQFEKLPIIQANEIYLPIKALASGLCAVPEVASAGVIIHKNGRQSLLKADSSGYVSLTQACRELDLAMTVTKTQITVRY